MMTLPLRLGIIGCSGHFGYVLNPSASVQLVAVAPGGADEDLSPLLRSAEVVAAAPRVYDDYRAMLDAGLDLVAINPQFHRHGACCLAALERGIAVFCEKPLALNLDELAAIRAAWQASGRPLGMMLDARYLPSFYTARKLVQAGVIGEPVLGYAQKSYKLGVRPAFYQRRATVGGLIPWVGIHAIDWFRFVSGREYASVTAHHGNTGAPDYPELENHATCQFTLDNGGSAVMSFDYLRPGAALTHGDDRLRLVGTAGVLEIRHPGFFEVITADGVLSITEYAPPLPLFADFVQAVLDPAHVPLVTAEDALSVTAIALRAREAADSGECVARVG